MNLRRVQKKGDKGLSQEYEKYRTVQHKNRKEPLPKITSTAMMDICDTEWPDDTSTFDIEEGISDIKYGKNEKNYEEKEAKCSDDTSTVDM